MGFKLQGQPAPAWRQLGCPAVAARRTCSAVGRLVGSACSSARTRSCAGCDTPAHSCRAGQGAAALRHARRAPRRGDPRQNSDQACPGSPEVQGAPTRVQPLQPLLSISGGRPPRHVPAAPCYICLPQWRRQCSLHPCRRKACAPCRQRAHVKAPQAMALGLCSCTAHLRFPAAHQGRLRTSFHAVPHPLTTQPRTHTYPTRPSHVRRIYRMTPRLQMSTASE